MNELHITLTAERDELDNTWTVYASCHEYGAQCVWAEGLTHERAVAVVQDGLNEWGLDEADALEMLGLL